MKKSNHMRFHKDHDLKIISEQYGYRGFANIKLYTLQHRLFSGGWSNPISREILDRKPVVAALPYDPISDEVILIEQFRAGAIDQPCAWIYEAVAGIVENDEANLNQAITRELMEETSLHAQQLLKIHEYWVSPGSSNEFITLYIAKVDATHAGGIHGLSEENEDIRVQVFCYQDAIDMLDNGLINNSLTIMALQWLRIHKEQLLSQWR